MIESEPGFGRSALMKDCQHGSGWEREGEGRRGIVANGEDRRRYGGGQFV